MSVVKVTMCCEAGRRAHPDPCPWHGGEPIPDSQCPDCGASGVITEERIIVNGDIAEVIVGPCPACQGTGSTVEPDAHPNRLLRRVCPDCGGAGTQP